MGTEAVPLDESEGLVRLLIKARREKIIGKRSNLVISFSACVHTPRGFQRSPRLLKSRRNQPPFGHNTDRTFSLLTMKVTSFFFTLGLGALAFAHSGHETSTNVKDLSAPSKWDSTIGKGAPALVELYVS